MPNEVRIDKWLWAVRVFKTRSLATKECNNGHVTLGPRPGITCKPSRMVKAGDVINVRRSPITYTYRVKAVTEARMGARLVPEYMEDITPPEELHIKDVIRIAGFVDRRKGMGRPTKREGRELARFNSEISDNVWFDNDDDTDFDDDDLV